ncbi:MAG TPA: hypothetical protein PLJ74_07805, partial [Myxococcota bacterium]|nr:hypothetical protein [Myxococcota bacterium]
MRDRCGCGARSRRRSNNGGCRERTLRASDDDTAAGVQNLKTVCVCGVRRQTGEVGEHCTGAVGSSDVCVWRRRTPHKARRSTGK